MIDCAHVGLDGNERRKWAFSRTDTERRGFPEDSSLVTIWEKAFGAPDGGFRVLMRSGNAILISLPSEAGPGHRALFSAGVEDYISKDVPLI
ncbi:MAG TPA: hypothetical protein VHD38_03785 [Candidatus Paceibacterota bacterium]|jgi:hypothetical protein|nr:hypothetical protein [Candidatus Paceibacterota bacterium]